MDAKSRAWQRLQTELKGFNSQSQPASALDPKKETLLQRFKRVTNTPLPKSIPAPEAA